MPNYIKRPEPGRFIRREKTVEKPSEPKEDRPEIDVNVLADAVALAISGLLPKSTTQIIHTDGSIPVNDSFDDSKTMDRLADQMIVERGNNKANFENLGNVKKTKRNQKDVDDTIDLLSKLDN